MLIEVESSFGNADRRDGGISGPPCNVFTATLHFTKSTSLPLTDTRVESLADGDGVSGYR